MEQVKVEITRVVKIWAMEQMYIITIEWLSHFRRPEGWFFQCE
jgi:hypothetical protein